MSTHMLTLSGSPLALAVQWHRLAANHTLPTRMRTNIDREEGELYVKPGLSEDAVARYVHAVKPTALSALGSGLSLDLDLNTGTLLVGAHRAEAEPLAAMLVEVAENLRPAAVLPTVAAPHAIRFHASLALRMRKAALLYQLEQRVLGDGVFSGQVWLCPSGGTRFEALMSAQEGFGALVATDASGRLIVYDTTTDALVTLGKQ